MDGAFAVMPRQARIFESSLHHSTRNTAFDALITDNLDQIARDFHSMGADSLPTPPAGTLLSEESATLIRELGDYFTRTAEMWSTMTQNLLRGPHIDQVTKDVTSRSNMQTCFIDMTAMTTVDVELSRLRYVLSSSLQMPHTHSPTGFFSHCYRQIRDLTAKFSQDVQAIWRPDGSISDPSSSSQLARGGQLPIANILCSPGQDVHCIGQGHPTNDNVNTLAGGITDQMDLGHEDDSDSDSGDEELFAEIDMDSLKQRGKGSHTCPKGSRCDKGGVDKDGNVIVFDRNSSFAYVPSPPEPP